MKKFWVYTLGAVAIAGVWGYFLDITKGNYYGFLYKIVLVFSFMVALQLSMARAQKKALSKQEVKVANNKPNNKKKKK